MISGHRGLEINEILQVIPRGLAELAQLFHAIHCLPRQWIRRASRTFTDQSLVLVALLLPLQDRFPPLLQIPASKKNTTIRQAIFCPVLSSWCSPNQFC